MTEKAGHDGSSRDVRMMTPRGAEQVARWVGACLILFTILARVMTSPSRTPYWDIDPVLNWSADTTRTPAMSLLFDALVWVATAMIVWAEGRAGRPIPWLTGLLALLGCVGVALHGWVLTPLVSLGSSPPVRGDFESLTLGSAWASAIIGAWALAVAAREPNVRRSAAAALMGVVVMLAAKGAMQVFVDHPRLLAEFERNGEAMLASQGIEPASSSARLFERRLRQAEATGWFGLANVYGSLVAAGLVGFLALAIGATRAARMHRRDRSPGQSHWRASRQWHPSGGEAALMWLVVVAGAFSLALSGSKGAIGAAAIGCACVVAWWWVRRKHEGEGVDTGCKPVPPREGREAATESSKWRTLLRWAPIVFPALALLAVGARGLVGERIGELSLYFRWQYLLAAGRIIAAHPILGVGPAGFKDQYLLFKEPTNPEEVDSPHSLLFDWTATLGVFGIAWCALFVAWLWRAGRRQSDTGSERVFKPRAPRPVSESSSESAVAKTVGARQSSTADSLRSLSVAPVVSIGASVGFLLWCEWAAIGMEALAVYLVAASAWWFTAHVAGRVASVDDGALGCALFATAVVLGTHAMIEVTGVWRSSAGWMLAAAALGAGGDMGGRAAARRRGLTIAVVGGALTVAGVLAFWSAQTYAVENYLRRAAGLARGTMRDDGAADIERLRRVRDMLSSNPIAWGIRPRLSYVDQEINLNWRLGVAIGSEWRGETGLYVGGAILTAKIRANAGAPRSAGRWVRLASLYEAASKLPGAPGHRVAAAAAWLRAAELDPHGLAPAFRLARLFASMDRPDEAARWARRALEINRNLRLDPLKGMTDTERDEMERLAGNEAKGGGRRTDGGDATGIP